MRQGGGAETEGTVVGRGTEYHNGRLPGLRETFGGGFMIQIPWEGSDSFVCRLEGGSSKFEEGTEALGTYVADFRAGGSRPLYGRRILQGGCASNTPVWR